jgi:hypothetical protein
MAAADAGDASFVSALPHALSLRVFALLPVDARARCAAVRRAWRAALDDPAAWSRLELSFDSGVRQTRLTDKTLLAAGARAAGRLSFLDVRGAHKLSHAALGAVLAANAGALAELRLAAWQLREEGPDAEGSTGLRLDVRRLAPALRTLVVRPSAVARVGNGDEEDEDDAGDNGPPQELSLVRSEVEALLGDGDGDAPRARLTRLEANVCCSLAEAPALLAAEEAPFRGRLALRRLTLVPDASAALAHLAGLGLAAAPPAAPLPPPPLAELGAALRRSKLTALAVAFLAPREPLMDALCTILDASLGHPTLTWLQLALPFEGPPMIARDGVPPALSARLGALLGADARALRTLRTRGAAFRDADAAPLLAGLRANTHLELLDLGDVNSLSAAFAAAQLLPTVRDGNASLRCLRLGESAADGAAVGVREAVQLVEQRYLATAEGAARDAALFLAKIEMCPWLHDYVPSSDDDDDSASDDDGDDDDEQ